MKELKIIEKYSKKLAEKARKVKKNEVVIIREYIKTLSKAKDLFLNSVLKKEDREKLSEGLLSVLTEIDANIFKDQKVILCK